MDRPLKQRTNILVTHFSVPPPGKLDLNSVPYRPDAFRFTPVDPYPFL